MSEEVNYAVGDIEIPVENTSTEPVVETKPTEPSAPEATEVATETKDNTVTNKYRIDDEEFDVDEIREWRKGNLRQSDYTKKTQELANLRKELQEADELAKYLKSKPELLQKLIEFDNGNTPSNVTETLDPVRQEINQLKTDLHMKDLDAKLKEITSNDKYVKDVELLEIANTKRVDLDTAYALWKGQNMDKILDMKLKEKETSIKEELAKNASETRTLINPSDNTAEPDTFGLSQDELKVAGLYGMSPEEYHKWKVMDNPW